MQVYKKSWTKQSIFNRDDNGSKKSWCLQMLRVTIALARYSGRGEYLFIST
jgi:hypothetical protein